MRNKRLSMALVSLSCFASLAPSYAHAEMSLKSTNFVEGATVSNAQVFNGFGCTGENHSPQLSWDTLPEGAKSLAITLYDPDAPTGSGWWHWTAFNIPISVNTLEENASAGAMPEGSIQGVTDFGSIGFGGACPPEGDAPHRYILTLHALDIETLDLNETSSGAMVGYYLNAHSLEKVQITALYGR